MYSPGGTATLVSDCPVAMSNSTPVDAFTNTCCVVGALEDWFPSSGRSYVETDEVAVFIVEVVSVELVVSTAPVVNVDELVVFSVSASVSVDSVESSVAVEDSVEVPVGVEGNGDSVPVSVAVEESVEFSVGVDVGVVVDDFVVDSSGVGVGVLVVSVGASVPFSAVLLANAPALTPATGPVTSITHNTTTAMM